jgi:hypothetical protein
MRFKKKTWITLGVGLFIIAAVLVYMVYQGQAKNQQEAEASLDEASDAVVVLFASKRNLEDKLSGFEEELTQWQGQIGQLEAELSQAISALGQTEARFPGSVESIEYDEALFGFARANDLEIESLGVTEPVDENVEGIIYSTTSFTLKVRGEVADILDFVNIIVTDDDFQTAILKSASIAIPRPLTELEKADLTEEEIKERETPSATITLTIYSYQGE